MSGQILKLVSLAFQLFDSLVMVKLAFYREVPRFLIVFLQYNSKASLISIFSNPSSADQGINLSFVKSDRISDLTVVVPGVQHSFTGVLGHHGVVAELIGELNVGVP